MADKLLEFGLQKVWDLLARESERLRGVDEQLAELKRDLNLLRSFLKDANAQKHTKETVKTCVEEIKEIVFDVEDLIETFLLKKELGRTSGIRKRIQRLSCVMGATGIRKLALDLGTTSKRITKVNRDMEHYGVQKMIVHGGEYSPPKGRCEKLPLQERQREMRKTFHSNNESDFVGLDENVKKLVGYLVEEDSIRVISITGMGGIGKTTLAREVFNHKMVKNHFDGVAWVCISQEFTRKYVWQTMLQKLSSEHRDSDMTKDELKLSSKHDEHRDSDMAEDELQDKLYRLLETRKCLIVMDDMWKEEDWDIIKDVFPSKKAAIWKVLLTSRNEKVALRADPTCVNVKPECLTFEQSWTLFRGIAFPRKDTAEIKVDVEMEEMGKQMVNHCGGLPLAVKVLGGSLATKYTLHDWKRLSENIGSRLVGGRTDINDDNMLEINYVLSLSFEELPSYLKHCFLYLAHFPEDHRIDVEALSYYWAAERIFEPRYYDGETIRDVGDVCIEELVRRNMVISKRKATNLRFETCQLHDMMREICLVKAKEENFLKITSSRPPTTNFQSPVTSRRFVAHYPTTLHVERHIDNPKLRSLVVISHNIWKSSWKLSGSSYTRLEVLRVLDLFKAEFKGGKLPSGIGKLIHLRYLSLEDAKVIHLPSSLGNLKLLIYLNLSLDINREGVFVPNVLMGMKELRYLRLPWMHEKTMLELSNLVNLETLTKFNTKNGSIEDLQGMVRLRTLHIKLSPNTSIETLSASIGGLKHLEDLTIEYDFGNDERKEEGLVWDFVDLKKLRLGIYMPRLPKEEHFPSHLTILDISCCHLEDDPMPILAKLLHLYEVKLGFESFCGKRIVCSGGGFPELQKLELNGLQEWEEWIVEESSMPLLHTLEIGQCPKLKKLPDGLHFPSHLTTIDLVCCGLEEDPIPILEKLVQLKWVNLRQCFSGRRMVFSAGGFPQLQKLRFYGQFDYLDRVNELEEWIVEEGSMAILNTMYILNCPNLKELPDGLQFINSLKDLKLDGKWKERLSEGGPDYYKVQHIPSVRLNFKKDMSFADSIKLLIEIEKQETRDAHLFSRILCI